MAQWQMKRAPAKSAPEAGSWSVAQAKARLSEVMERAAFDGPQSITRNGKPMAVLVSAELWRSLSPLAGEPATARLTFWDAARAAAGEGVDLDVARDGTWPDPVRL
jgi:prevent-host-death family protein